MRHADKRSNWEAQVASTPLLLWRDAVQSPTPPSPCELDHKNALPVVGSIGY